MGITINPSAPYPGGEIATYLRICVTSIDLRPARLNRMNLMTIPPDRKVSVWVYAYADISARAAGKAPVWSDHFDCTVADLDILDPNPTTQGGPFGDTWKLREDLEVARHIPEGAYKVLKERHPSGIDHDGVLFVEPISS